ncbi:MAG: permease-like cell division protein FtsX [Clostridiales bacterium]|jgi:cell division transport system permease protein|nr:permease-like cell division protein FtsX [Eubacteriales bacterium]MDH7565783.1 permease-like cell division protein FtsX [Clostridiales bacterium]
MKNIFLNMGYFLKETITVMRLNLLSNILSIFSTGLILFILAMTISGWRISAKAAEAIEGEAEISVYFDKGMDNQGALKLVESIKRIEGVRDSRLIGESEAYDRMVKILGKDAQVLKVFDDNPFSPFIEVKINLNAMDHVLEELDHMTGIQYIRDNRDVLDRLGNITHLFRILGYLMGAAVGIATLVILSHMIRLGMQNNREQINTLRLLGAPGIFIAFPFLLQGLLLTLGGGALAAALAAFALKQLYARMAGPLPFIPLPPGGALISGMVIVILSVSAVLGIVGSLLGLLSARNH